MTVSCFMGWSAIAAFGVALGCGNGGQAPEALAPSKAETRDAAPSETAGAGLRADLAVKEGPPAGDEKRPLDGEILLDLAASSSMAHLRSGGLLVDFGTPSRHKYTLGDWKTGWRGDFEVDGTTFSYASGNASRIFFTVEPAHVGAGAIVVRGKAMGKAPARVYLNGEHIGALELPTDGHGHGVVRFAQGLVAGTNELMLRFNGSGRGVDGVAALAAIDYVRIVEGEEEEGAQDASASDAVLVAGPQGTPRGLVLAATETLTYNLRVAEGAVLVGRARASGVGANAALRIEAAKDDGTSSTLASIELSPRETQVRVDLGELRGEVVALSIGAADGEVTFLEPAVRRRPVERRPAPGRAVAKNAVLVLIDTLRYDRLTLCNPDTRVRTPFMDGIGPQTMVFTRALAQENWTKPSIATLLTGLFPETHQTKTEKSLVPRTVPLVSEHLSRLGFATAGFVANGYVSGKFGFERGWDTWTNYVREGKPNRAQFVADDAAAWIRARQKDRPFFLYVHTIDPHVPYIPPKEYRALYDDEPYDGPVSPFETAKLLERIKTGAVKLSARDRIRLEALYDGEVSYHDDHLARVYAALEEEGLLEDTVVIITADHGEEFFEHGSVGHGHSMYEELLHVPLIVRLPGATGAKTGPPARCDEEVGLVDVLPTLCAVLGVECPPDVEGRSLTPLLAGAAEAWPRASYSEFLDGQRVARSGDLKLIYRGLRTTLFDLRTDPGETTDLSARRPVSLALMRELLGAHLGRFVDNGPRGASEDGTRPAGKKKHAAVDATIDRETRKQLEALGYMGD